MNEKTKILEMLENGKITVEEAERLLAAVEDVKPASEKKHKIKNAEAKVTLKNGKLKGKLKIVVDSKDGDNVRVTIPLKLARTINKFLPKEALESITEEGINIESIIASIEDSIDEIDEDLVNVTSSDGESVRIFIEK